VSAPPAADTFGHEEEPTTTRGVVPDEVLKKATPEPRPAPVSEMTELPAATVRRDAEDDGRGNRESDLPTIEFTPAGRRRSPSQADVDALIAKFGVSGAGETPRTGALKAMAGLEPTPPPPAYGPPSSAAAASEDSELDSLLTASTAAPPAAPRDVVDERQLPTQPSKLRARATLPSTPQAKPARGARTLLVLAIVAIAAGVYGVWQLRPNVRAGDAPQTSGPTPKTPSAAQSACKGTLVITDVPLHAEVLMREGQAPVDVERMPVGTRLEFVATAEGFAPKRVVVPAGANWDAGPDGKPRLEVAVQLDKSHARAGTNDPWPAGEPGSTVGGKGPPGTVHVVATPRGAEVWLLAGIGPEARVEQVSCDQDVDVLLAGPTTYRKRLHVPTSAFAKEDASASPTVGSGTSPSVALVSAK
jgi:hypothetical protein